MPGMPASRAPLLGQDLAAARDAWFFQWFHLTRQISRREQEGGLIRFVPQGGAFRDRVALDVAIDGAGHITALTLGLARLFVDDPDDGPYARDIAQAFLRAVLPAAEGVPARALADEIAGAGGEAESERGPTEGYAVYLGLSPECVLESHQARVHVANLRIEGDDWLLLTVSRES